MGHEYYWASTQTKVTGFRLTYSLQLNAVKSFYIFPFPSLLCVTAWERAGWQERCLVLMIVFIPLPSAAVSKGAKTYLRFNLNYATFLPPIPRNCLLQSPHRWGRYKTSQIGIAAPICGHGLGGRGGGPGEFTRGGVGFKISGGNSFSPVGGAKIGLP